MAITTYPMPQPETAPTVAPPSMPAPAAPNPFNLYPTTAANLAAVRRTAPMPSAPPANAQAPTLPFGDKGMMPQGKLDALNREIASNRAATANTQFQMQQKQFMMPGPIAPGAAAAMGVQMPTDPLRRAQLGLDNPQTARRTEEQLGLRPPMPQAQYPHLPEYDWAHTVEVPRFYGGSPAKNSMPSGGSAGPSGGISGVGPLGPPAAASFMPQSPGAGVRITRRVPDGKGGYTTIVTTEGGGTKPVTPLQQSQIDLNKARQGNVEQGTRNLVAATQPSNKPQNGKTMDDKENDDIERQFQHDIALYDILVTQQQQRKRLATEYGLPFDEPEIPVPQRRKPSENGRGSVSTAPEIADRARNATANGPTASPATSGSQVASGPPATAPTSTALPMGIPSAPPMPQGATKQRWNPKTSSWEFMNAAGEIVDANGRKI